MNGEKENGSLCNATSYASSGDSYRSIVFKDAFWLAGYHSNSKVKAKSLILTKGRYAWHNSLGNLAPATALDGNYIHLNPVLSQKNAGYIDKKIDDGIIDSGNVFGIFCTEYGDSNSLSDTEGCSLIFKLGLK